MRTGHYGTTKKNNTGLFAGRRQAKKSWILPLLQQLYDRTDQYP